MAIEGQNISPVGKAGAPVAANPAFHIINISYVGKDPCMKYLAESQISPEKVSKIGQSMVHDFKQGTIKFDEKINDGKIRFTKQEFDEKYLNAKPEKKSTAMTNGIFAVNIAGLGRLEIPVVDPDKIIAKAQQKEAIS